MSGRIDRWERITAYSFPSNPRFSSEQKQTAVDHYFEHVGNISRTARVLGYPSRTLLTQWIDELRPGIRKIPVKSGNGLRFTQEQKCCAVIDLCTRTGSASEVAETIGVTPQALYGWKRELLGKGVVTAMEPKNDNTDSDDHDELIREVESLKTQIHKLQLEHDILKKANELLKKDQGIDPQNLTNREKQC